MEQEPKQNKMQLSKSLAVTSVDDVARLSKIFFDSKLFTDIASMAQAGVKIMAGAELGITPFQSISGVHIIKGKPVIGAGLMAAMLDSHPEYDFEVLQHTDKVCEIQFYKNNKKKGISKFTEEDAKKAGTQNMGKFPANMLYARAMSNGVKWYAPGLFSGPVYVPEEMQQEPEVETTYEEVKTPVQPKTEVIQDAVVVEEPAMKWASEKQKELIRNLAKSHHISEEERRSVQEIESNYEGEFPLSEFERVFAELQELIKQGLEYEKNTPATAELIEEIEIHWAKPYFTEAERTKGMESLKKGYSIAKARATIATLEEKIAERSNAQLKPVK